MMFKLIWPIFVGVIIFLVLCKLGAMFLDWYDSDESSEIDGYYWAKGEYESGKSIESIEAYIDDSSDNFDEGAREYLREINNG